MFDLRKVHEYAVNKATGQARLVRTNPALCARRAGESPIFVQGGQICTEGGQPLREIPEWFWDDARTMSLEARQEVGLVLPEEQQGASKPVSVDLVNDVDEEEDEELELELPSLPTDWACPDCGEFVKKNVKGVHIARHRRAAKRGK